MLSIAVKPDLKTLCNELVSISNWRKLGLNLGVQDYELAKIQTSHPNERCDEWKREVFSQWLRCTPSASWRDVVQALRQMGENTEAKRIELKYNGGPVCKLVTVYNAHHEVCSHSLWCVLS